MPSLFTVALVTLSLGGTDVAAKPRLFPNSPAVSGTILDASKIPIPDVEIRLEWGSDSSRRVRTGTDGIFSFDDVPDGAARMAIRRLGYLPRQIRIDVGSNAARHLEIVLQVVPRELENVVVIGQDSRLREFYERRTSHGAGSFLTQEDIRKINPHVSSEIFRRIAGASIRSARFGNAVRLRGCRPNVWMDGVPVHDVELDELTDPAAIAGLEIYTSPNAVPAQYMDHEPRPCGSILVWTRVD